MAARLKNKEFDFVKRLYFSIVRRQRRRTSLKLVLPVIRGLKGFSFLMTDETSSQSVYIAPQEPSSFGRVQARYETEYFTAYECKHSTQKIFVSQCTLKTAYKK